MEGHEVSAGNSVLLRAQLALLLAIFGVRRRSERARADCSGRRRRPRPGEGAAPDRADGRARPRDCARRNAAGGPGAHTGQALARLLDQPRRLRRAAANRVDAARGRYRRADAVPHSEAAATGPADGLRLRGRGRVSRDDRCRPDAEAGAGASGRAGELAGVRAGLHSRQGASGIGPDGAAWSAAGAARWRAGRGHYAGPEAAARGGEVHRHRRRAAVRAHADRWQARDQRGVLSLSQRSRCQRKPAARCDRQRGGAEDRTAARWRAAHCATLARSRSPARSAAWSPQAIRHSGLRRERAGGAGRSSVAYRRRPGGKHDCDWRNWPGVSRRHPAEPDAVRLSGPLSEGACAGAEFESEPRASASARSGLRAGNPALLLGDCGRAAGVARHGKPRGLGVPVAVAGLHRAAWRR